MKILLTFMALWFTASVVRSQTVLFLHHSTGGFVYSQGNVSDFIGEYNGKNGTNIQITERSYPNNPYPWDNYPYDYWNLWINMQCDNSSGGIECLESLASSNDIIIWKHCFPGAGIVDGSLEGNISSSSKTLANYKLQYRALRDKMDVFPHNQFIVWTLVPLHRLATNAEQAVRAGEFVNWVKNQWLSEDGKNHPNIHIFDYFGLTAQTEENPAYGFQYCLKYEYERSHEDTDSHPNRQACETVGPLFAQFIIEVATNGNGTTGLKETSIQKLKVFPNPTTGPLKITGNPSLISKPELFDVYGRKVLITNNNTQELNISHLSEGLYFLKIEREVYKIIKN